MKTDNDGNSVSNKKYAAQNKKDAQRYVKRQSLSGLRRILGVGKDGKKQKYPYDNDLAQAKDDLGKSLVTRLAQSELKRRAGGKKQGSIKGRKSTKGGGGGG